MLTAVQQRIKYQWLDAEDQRDRLVWADALRDTRHDVYHLAEYVRIDAALSEGSSLGFYATDGTRKLFIPLSIRSVADQPAGPDEFFDAASPYGYPSPCSKFAPTDSDDQRQAFVRDALAELVAGLRQRNVVAAFIRSHPLLNDCFAGFEDSSVIVQHGESVYCDLHLTEEQMWQQTRRRDRSYINRSRREGYRLVRDHQWSQLDKFIQIYEETMERVTAADFYFFPKSYFESLRDNLRENASLVFVMSPDDEVTCGGIFTNCDEIVQYHLGATADAFRRVQPAKLLIDGVRRWAKDAGHRYLHLGGGVGASVDSLLHFKAGFSKLRAPFASCRLVTDPAAYAKLVQHWEHVENRKAEGMTGYFPAYRQPPPTLRIVDADGESRRAMSPRNGNRRPNSPPSTRRTASISISKMSTQKRRAA